MTRRGHAIRIVLASLLSLAACTAADDGQPEEKAPDRDRAMAELGQKAGSDVALEVGETGLTRVIAMAPRYPIPGRDIDPAAAAIRFLGDHRDAFQLDASEIGSFTVARVDRDPGS